MLAGMPSAQCIAPPVFVTGRVQTVGLWAGFLHCVRHVYKFCMICAQWDAATHVSSVGGIAMTVSMGLVALVSLLYFLWCG